MLLHLSRLHQRLCRAFFFCLMTMLVACQSKPDAYDTQHRPVSFSALHGQYVFINYFAAFCKPCWTEIPALNAFSQHYKDKITVLGVNYDAKDNTELSTLIQKMGITYPVLTDDPGKKFGILHVEGLPMTVIINPQGKKIKTLMGEQTEDSLLKAAGLA